MIVPIILGLFAAFVSDPSLVAAVPAKPLLTLDDVLNLQRVDRASYSPDGDWLAVVVQRPASPGEVYGRTSYEIDPSRDDVWLVSTSDGRREQITNGSADAAGYWCATWSPDGQRLAMLSTSPEKGEPRGGDNVRLYVWDRSHGVTRASPAAVMTQTRYGGGLYPMDLRGGADGGTVAHSCESPDENAPFLWLDKERLLVVDLPSGQVSGLLDQYGRPFRQAAQDAVLLHNGLVPTADAVGSGAERTTASPGSSSAIIRIVDVQTDQIRTIAEVPTYPFRGGLTLSVSPDRKQLAILATIGALQPAAGHSFPNTWDDAWTVERRLGFADLRSGAPVRWVTLPDAARLPLELFGWSRDNRWVAVRGRSGPFETATPLYAVEAVSGRSLRLGKGSVGEAPAGSGVTQTPAALWVSSNRLLAQVDDSKTKVWWLLGVDGSAKRLTGPSVGGFVTGPGGKVLTASGNALMAVNMKQASLVPVRRFDGDVSIWWPNDSGTRSAKLLLAISGADKATNLRMISLATGEVSPSLQAVTADLGPNLLDVNCARDLLSWKESNQGGLFIQQSSLSASRNEKLLSLDTYLSGIEWGRIEIINYNSDSGEPLQGAVILPPRYHPGRRYPTLVWVYGGYKVRGSNDYWLDPFLPGIYNLQLYAAQNYLVLIPSMPLPARSERQNVYDSLTNGVLPAIDKLVKLGIADPERVGVMGQSFGGYSVYGLVTQTDRFKAAVAIAGITDLRSHFGQFSPLARGYSGIEHEMSDNWAEMDLWGLYGPPQQDEWGYDANSPLTHVDRVHTPLLMVHGDLDIRGSVQQAEQFFYGLYAQGKTAKLIRYGGESHSLGQSPANVRDVFKEIIDWFDKYLR